jgi:hypothetical protein
MSRRRAGQGKFGFAVDRGQHSSLDELARLIDRVPIDRPHCVISCAAKGEPAWPPMALFKAMLLLIWYTLSDVKLAEALDDRGSFRRCCGFGFRTDTGAHGFRALSRNSCGVRHPCMFTLFSVVWMCQLLSAVCNLRREVRQETQN